MAPREGLAGLSRERTAMSSPELTWQLQRNASRRTRSRDVWMNGHDFDSTRESSRMQCNMGICELTYSRC